VTPATKDGYKYLHHVRLLPARLSALYPAKDLSAESVAFALFQFFVTYGISEVLITDPGSNLNSLVVKLLLKWMGVRLRMSITNRHQSNFVERTHREVIRFLTDLDVVWILNSESISEHEIEKFSSKCNFMNYKLQMLWSLKQKIKQSSKRLSVVKCHLCKHLPYNWSQFGCLKDIDTALAEHSHIEDKALYQQSSKRVKSTQSVRENSSNDISIFDYTNFKS
jgi:hypothetical protein